MAGEAPIPHPDTWPVRELKEFSLKIGSGATPTGGEASYLPRRHRWTLDVHFINPSPVFWSGHSQKLRACSYDVLLRFFLAQEGEPSCPCLLPNP